MDYGRADLKELLKDGECYVISNYGDYKMKIEDFNEFDEMMQVNIGEEGGNFKIFVGVLSNGLRLDWKEMYNLCVTHNETLKENE